MPGIYTEDMLGGKSFEDLKTGKKYHGESAQHAWADNVGGKPIDGATGEKGYSGEWAPDKKGKG